VCVEGNKGEEEVMNVMKVKEEEREEEVREGRGAQFTERDAAAIRWLAEVRAANLAQLRVLLGQLGQAGDITPRRCAQIVVRWERLGLVEKTTIWHQEPAIVWLTSRGAQMAGLNRLRRPAIGTLHHTLAVTQVRLQACRPSNGRGWLSERELRGLLSKESHIPDGGLVEADGSVTAIEMELTPHGRQRVRGAMTSLLAERVEGGDRFSKLLYLVAPACRRQVEMVRVELPQPLRERVAVLPWGP